MIWPSASIAQVTPQNRQPIGKPASIRAMQAAFKKQDKSWGADKEVDAPRNSIRRTFQRSNLQLSCQLDSTTGFTEGYRTVVVQHLKNKSEGGARMKWQEHWCLTGFSHTLLLRTLPYTYKEIKLDTLDSERKKKAHLFHLMVYWGMAGFAYYRRKKLKASWSLMYLTFLDFS